tara:strand:+ start:222 stop:1034 length:813 start_codon:yes stop_codon:yes gene_type:complete
MSTPNKPTGKKRGRKPKGGKIVNNINTSKKPINVKPNIILHLKCNQQDIDNYKINSEIAYSGDTLINNKINQLKYNDVIEEDIEHVNDLVPDPNCINKEICTKLKKLQLNLHNNNISDKKSACFWCTCEFDNPPIYIPKYEFKDTYYVYGCFCSPECAAAYLFNESIDSSIKFERYHLLNFIYSKIYNYTKNIKPAPSPYYTLDKYFGNLSTQEYRKLLNNDRLLIVVDKPLTRELPELIETNDDILYKPHTMIKLHEAKQTKTTSSIFN